MKNLKELMEQRSISAEELAPIIPVSARQIYRWIAGQAEITSSNLIALANFFGCTTDEILGRENYVTGNIEIVGEKLSAKEQKVIDCYRSLTEDGKSAFIAMAENVANMYKRASKIS